MFPLQMEQQSLQKVHDVNEHVVSQLLLNQQKQVDLAQMSEMVKVVAFQKRQLLPVLLKKLALVKQPLDCLFQL